jgi:segregation and condensation protein A
MKILPHILKVQSDSIAEVKDDKLKKIVKGRIISVEEKMTYVRNIMKENESVRFTSLIESNDKNEVIATFLSMLELIKTNEVFVVQDLFLGDILIKRNMEC